MNAEQRDEIGVAVPSWLWVQGVTQIFWEDDVLKELGKTYAGHGLVNAWNAFLIEGSVGVLKLPGKVQGQNHWLGPGAKSQVS